MRDSTKATYSPFEVELFSTKKQWIAFVCACLLVCIYSVWQEYRHYVSYTTSNDTQEIYAQVIAQYSKEKNGKSYYVLKLKSEKGEMFYTTSKEDIKDLTHRFLRIYGKRLECSFVQYLQSCFFVSYRINVLSDRDYRDVLRYWIDSQHDQPLISSLYKTLFMADFLPHVWRDLSNKLGIAHLIAISGFHLGILSFVIGGFLNLIYRIFHSRVSYRNRYFDIGIIVLFCLFLYLILLDFSPSFLRAFVMAAFGYFLVYSGIKLLSFRLLFVVVCVCLALFPRLIFSIGFALSVSGVFFIYLFVKHIHFNNGFLHKIVLLPIVFNTLIFIDMLPLVHWFFPYFTPLCLLCIPLSLLFVVFFPFMLVAHILRLGFICDSFFEWSLGISITALEFYTPWWFLIIFLICCAISMYSKITYYILHVLGGGFFIYLLVSFVSEV